MLGFILGHDIGRGQSHRAKAAASIEAPAAGTEQILRFGALTPPATGGARPLGPDGESDLVSILSISPASDTGWTIVGGRLVRDSGTPADSDGSVLTCRDSLGRTLSLTIAVDKDAFDATNGAELEAAVGAIRAMPGYGSTDWTVFLRPGRHPAATIADGTWIVPDRQAGTTKAVTIPGAYRQTRLSGFSFSGVIDNPNSNALTESDLDRAARSSVTGGSLSIVGRTPVDGPVPVILDYKLLVSGVGPVSLRQVVMPEPAVGLWINRDDGNMTATGVYPGAVDLRVGVPDMAYPATRQGDLITLGETNGVPGPRFHCADCHLGIGWDGLDDARRGPAAISAESAAQLVVEDVAMDGIYIPFNLAYTPEVAVRRIRIQNGVRTQLRSIPTDFSAVSPLAARVAQLWRFQFHDIVCGRFAAGGDFAGLHANAISIGGQSNSTNGGADAPTIRILITRCWFDMRVPPERWIPTADTFAGEPVNFFGYPLSGTPVYNAARSSLGARIVPGAYNPGVTGELSHCIFIVNSVTGADVTQGDVVLRHNTFLFDFDHDSANGASNDVAISCFGPSVGAPLDAMAKAYRNIAGASMSGPGQIWDSESIVISNKLDDGSASDYATVFGDNFAFDARRRIALDGDLVSVKDAIDAAFSHVGGTHGHTGAIERGAPALLDLNPANGSSAHGINDPLVIGFDRPVVLMEGAVRIRRVADDTVVETITIDAKRGVGVGSGAGRVLNGERQVIIQPASPLVGNENYYVEIDAGLVRSIQCSDTWAGLSGSASWQFTAIDNSVHTELIAFNGLSDQLTRASLLNLGGPISALTFVVEYRRNSGEAGGPLLQFGTGTNRIAFEIQATGKPKLYGYQTSLVFSKETASAPADGVEHRVIATWDGSTGTMRVYVDDAANLGPFGSVATRTIDLGTLRPVAIGSNGSGTFFRGSIRRVAVWAGVAPDVTDASVRLALGTVHRAAEFASGPLLDFRGALADWRQGSNFGAGGDFVVQGLGS